MAIGQVQTSTLSLPAGAGFSPYAPSYSTVSYQNADTLGSLSIKEEPMITQPSAQNWRYGTVKHSSNGSQGDAAALFIATSVVLGAFGASGFALVKSGKQKADKTTPTIERQPIQHEPTRSSTVASPLKRKAAAASITPASGQPGKLAKSTSATVRWTSSGAGEARRTGTAPVRPLSKTSIHSATLGLSPERTRGDAAIAFDEPYVEEQVAVNCGLHASNAAFNGLSTATSHDYARFVLGHRIDQRFSENPELHRQGIEVLENLLGDKGRIAFAPFLKFVRSLAPARDNVDALKSLRTDLDAHGKQYAADFKAILKQLELDKTGKKTHQECKILFVLIRDVLKIDNTTMPDQLKDWHNTRSSHLVSKLSEEECRKYAALLQPLAFTNLSLNEDLETDIHTRLAEAPDFIPRMIIATHGIGDLESRAGHWVCLSWRKNSNAALPADHDTDGAWYRVNSIGKSREFLTNGKPDREGAALALHEHVKSMPKDEGRLLPALLPSRL